MAEFEDDQESADRGGGETEANLSRREWLLRLGESVTLLGFSGVAGSDRSATAFAAGLTAADLSVLPPGLYTASSEYLGHALMNDDPFHPVPPGSETEYVKPRSRPFQPQFFSAGDFGVIERLVALMLGEGETADAGSAAIVEDVAEWVDRAVASAGAAREAARGLSPEHRQIAVGYCGQAAVEKAENNNDPQIAREGLRWLAHNIPSGDFLVLSQEQQVRILEQISDGRTGKSESAGTRFFQLLKAEVVRGFYTSRQGLKELDYKGNAFYAVSPGCSHEQHTEASTSNESLPQR